MKWKVAPLVVGCLALGRAAMAQDNPALSDYLGYTELNRVGLSYRLGFNISADFKQLGGFAALNPATNPRHPLRTPNGDLFNYDNGYIYSDTTAAAHPGYTWYYGYVTGTAQRPAGAPTDFDLYRSSSPANVTSRNNEGDPQHGFELTYSRQFGKASRGFWGLESGFGFTDLSISDSRTLHGLVSRATDTYRTGGGAILKPPPFSGTAEGPAEGDPNGWPLVGLNPVSSSTDPFAGAATITGRRELTAQLASLRVGPYLDLPFSRHCGFSLSGGFVLMQVWSDFKFNESVALDPSLTLTTLPPELHRGSGSHQALVAGGYLGGTFSYAFNDHLRLFAGGQFQYTGDYTHTEAGKKAVLSLGQALFVPVGVTFSF